MMSAPFPYTESDWRVYFKDYYEGLGTTYERFILHHYFEKISKEYAIQSVLEVPSFGMTGISGINSMWWASHGIPVTVVDDNRERIELIRKTWQEVSLHADFICQPTYQEPLPFQNDAFDMSWNFASLWAVNDLNRFLQEMARVTTKALFICLPNRYNIFRIPHKAGRSDYATHCNLMKIKNILLKLHWEIADQGFMDTPLWPDIGMKKEDFLQKIGLKWLANKIQAKEEGYLCILDYFSGKNKSMEKEILRYGVLEKLPSIVKKYWAHHHYVIFTPL